MDIKVKTSSRDYEIVLQRGALNRLCELLPPCEKTLIVTDSGVPREYAECALASLSRHGDCEVLTVPRGESSKCFDSLTGILNALVNGGYNRKSRVVALGGGVVGDLAGFAASIYMRGVDFVNVPTTLLSQVDSSVGGKTAIDFKGIKNVVGSFYQPSGVIIDPDTLKTLSRRQLANGMAESLKMALTGDKEMFEIFENGDPFARVDEIICRSLKYKISIVECDERESGLRRVLNFGHTVGHAVESASGGSLLHGECVAVGMLPMCSPALRERLLPVYKKLGLPEKARCDKESALKFILNDKKAAGGGKTVTVRCFAPGTYELVETDMHELGNLIDTVVTE